MPDTSVNITNTDGNDNDGDDHDDVKSGKVKKKKVVRYRETFINVLVEISVESRRANPGLGTFDIMAKS